MKLTPNSLGKLWRRLARNVIGKVAEVGHNYLKLFRIISRNQETKAINKKSSSRN